MLWDRLPYATAPILTSEDLAVQRDMVRSSKNESDPVVHSSSQFLEIWNEDGVTAEPEEDVFE